MAARTAIFIAFCLPAPGPRTKNEMQSSEMPWPGDEGEERWNQAWLAIKKGSRCVLAGLYVGNLAWQVDSGRLQPAFSEHGKVVDARVIYDRETGRSHGFGMQNCKLELYK